MTVPAGRSFRLSQKRRDLLEALQRREGVATASAVERIPRRADRGALPLSFAQQRFWFLDQLEPGSFAYNVPLAVRLHGTLDVPALRASLAEIVRRHEALRTRFPSFEGQPLQIVDPPYAAEALPLIVLSLEELPETEREAEAERRVRAELLRPFDLEAGPLFRCTLLRLAADLHVAIVVMHHIVSDGWSVGVLTRELGALYAAFREGRPSPLPELPIQYADFAAWQRETLSGEKLEGHLGFWRERLAGAPEFLSLPTDHPRPAVQGAEGGSRLFSLSAVASQALQALARAEDATLFMVLLAAWGVVLSRWSGADDVVVGTPIANRNRAEIDGLIGSFINTLALRVDLTGDPEIRTLLGRVHDLTLGAYTHQDLPFEKLIDELGVRRDSARNPLVQVMLALQNAPAGELRLPGLTLQPQPLEGEVARLDLTLSLSETPDGLTGTLYYRADLFEAATVDRLLGNFRTVLEGIAADPDRRVSALALLTADERELLLDAWSEPALPAQGFLQLFRKQAESHPEMPAVACDGEVLTYGALAARAWRLAHHLRRLGAGPEVPVAICLEPSVDMVVTLLGVLSAGAAYLPLDPSHPEERLSLLIEDAKAPVVIADRELKGARLLWIDDPSLAKENVSAPEIDPDARSLAYVIYTSGSTGVPKGVGVAHAQLANYVRALLERLEPASGIPRGARFGIISTFAADLGHTMLFPALAAGGCLEVLTGRATDPERLADALRQRPLDYLKIVPSHLSALLASPWAEDLLPRRALVLGGEATNWSLAERIAALAPGCRIFNHYGPTETTVGVIAGLADPAASPRWSSILPLGRQLAGLRLYVLGTDGEPMPAGVAGQLYVGGAGVSRGYLGRPDATAERFLPDPFSGVGERLYRTGDLVRALPDGRLEFLGRADQQVKIRGYRIELGEVEAALRTHPDIREAAVVAREETPGEKRLAAFLVMRDEGAEPDVAELRAFLGQRLPEAMIPALFVTLPALPLTSNGKVDRRDLVRREFGPVQPSSETGFAAPRTPAEAALAAIWGEVLKLERVGIHDNFFALGGDSILSLQVAARAFKAGLQVRSRQMFQHQTIAELAAAVAPAGEPVAASAYAPSAGPIPLTPIQHWFFAAEPPRPEHYNQSVMLTLADRWDAAVLERAVAAVIGSHPALRLRFHQEDGQWVQEETAPVETAPFSRIDLSALPADRWPAELTAAADDLQASLDLGAGPLLRVARLEPGRGEPDRLLIAIHHLAVDGVSWRVLLEDLETAARSLASGQEPELPLAGTSYREWSQRLTAWAGSPAAENELEHWLSLPVPAPLPRDGAEPSAGPGPLGTAERVVTLLDAADTAALLHEVPRVWRTQINDALLSALARALAPATGGAPLLVALEAHGREELFDGVDLSRSVGWFTTLYPVALPGGDGPAGPALRAAKEVLRAVPGRGLGYGALRWLGRSETRERLSARPAPEVAFNYLGQLDQVLAEGSPFAPAPEDGGAPVSPSWPRRHLLEINGGVLDGRLQMSWTFPPTAFRRETVEAWAARFAATLRELVEASRAAGAGGATPSDFPLVRLTQEQVDGLEVAGRLEDVYPLSPMQQGMLFHTLAEPGSGIYVDQQSCILEGDLDAGAFHRAWQRVVDRHPILRTAFAWETEPLQLVRERAVLPWTSHDWRGLPAAARVERLEALMNEDRLRGFDPAVAPLLRLTLIRLEHHRWQLVWSHHHLLLDGWSTAQVLAEVTAFYDAFQRGADLDLPRPRPYRDYIEWLQQQDPARVEAFWRETLRGFSEATPLGLDRPTAGASAATSEAPANADLEMTREETLAVAAAARRLQITLNTLVLGAWAVLLARYSGRRDIVFGATSAGRPPELAGIETMIGLFINTTPVRVRIAPGEPLAAWLERLQRDLAEQRQYEHAPLARVQRWSEISGGAPLFESLFVFENYPVGEALARSGDSLSMTGFQSHAQTNYPLNVVVDPGERLGVRLAYDERRFDPAAVRRILAHLRTLLVEMALRPEAPVDALEILPAAERAQLLTEWSVLPEALAGTAHGEACVHWLFEEQARRTPDALAVVQEERRLTYRELDERANRLARRLRTLGVIPGERVVVSLDRSPEIAVAFLGVLKAGGAYVPIDPAYPAERQELMLTDSGALALVADRTVEGTSIPVVRLDPAGSADLDAESGAPLSGGASPRDLANVIYTSGSTGRPKGVLIEHASVAQRVRAVAEHYDLGPGDCALQFVSMGFDVVGEEILPLLVNGAAVAFYPEPKGRSAADLVAFCERHDVTKITFPSSYWFALIEELEAENLPLPSRLRVQVLGGDALQTDKVRRFARRYLRQMTQPQGLQLVNCYGPTEATILASFQHVDPAALDDLPTVPIGRPFPGALLYVVDPDLRPLPAGAAGELCIGGRQGVGLARGYLGRPDLTAERFVPDPFTDEPGARMYRTGDLVRHLPDGRILFLGRVDRQVKIRGYRIELEEIEARLAAHPGLGSVAVIVREDAPGDRRIVAYTVARTGSAPSVDELREFLLTHLPAYMVPSAFVALPALPLTTNGKLDRAALPVPGAAGSDEEYTAPRTPEERTLARVWEQVLGATRVGIHDNFFALGGDSILSIQVVARASQQGLRLSPGQVFEHPTVAELATVAVRGGALDAEQGTVSGPVPATPIQSWFFAQGLANPHHWNQAVFLEARRPLDPVRVERAVERLVAHHDALRLRFTPEDGGWRQWNADLDGPSSSLRIDLGSLPAERWREAVEAVAEGVQASLHLTHGPLFRAALFDLGAAEPQRLLLVAHHLCVDGVSWRILLEDLHNTYAQLESGERVRLPAKTTSFRSWAERLVRHAGSPEVASELPFWSTPARAEAALPFASLGAEGGSDREEGRVSVVLDAGETRALLNDVPPVYRTQINDVLLTALARSYRELAGRGRLLVDLEGHGREELFGDVDLSRTVGWFTSLYPVLLDLEPSAPPAGDLKAVKEQLRRVPRRGIGYGLLRHLASGETAERLRILPAAQIAFNYLGQLDQALGEEGLFHPAGESAGSMAPPDVKSPYPLTVSGRVAGGRLQLDLAYDGSICSRDTAERLAGGALAALRDLIAHCQTPGTFGYTPSDFPLAGLGRRDVDELTGEIGRIEDLYPLSPLQEGMLLHALVTPESRIGFEQTACLLQGDFDPVAFRRAWQATAERHPALRSVIRWRGLSRPLQAVLPGVEPGWREEDWRGLDAEERLAQVLAEERQRGFDLETPPLLRIGLFRVADDAWRFVLSLHHIFQDGWSLSILLRDVFALYEAFRRGVEPALGEAPRFREAIAWLERQDLSEAEAFWRGELAGLTAPTLLAEAPTPLPAGTPEAGEEILDLTPEDTAALESLARHLQVTLNTVVQGAWALLLSRITGEEDVVFGATVSGRPAEVPRVDSIIGLFINNLPVRTAVPSSQPLGAWLRSLHDRQAAAARFEHTPLFRIQSWSGLPPALPLFDNLIVFENYPLDALLREEGGREEGGHLEVLDIRGGVRANFPFTLVVGPGASLQLKGSYERRFFDQPEAAALLGRLRDLLGGFAADPTRTLGEILPPEPRALRARPALAAAESVAERPRPDFVAPRTPLELELVQILEATLGRRPIGVRDNFFDLGGHSLLALHVLSEIRRRLGRDLPLSVLFEAGTAEALAGFLERSEGPAEYRPLVAIQPEGDRRPLFVIHPGGGNVICYVPLARLLGTDRPFYAIQSREAFDGEEAPHPTVEEMSARYVQAIREVQPAGPYLLAGWSFGGVVAFEMARQLQEQGESVDLLAIFDQSAPRGTEDPEWYDDSHLLVDIWPGVCPVSAEELRGLGDLDRQLTFLLELAREEGRLPAGFGLREGRTLLRIVKGHIAAGQSYRPLYYPGKVTLFRCEEQPEGQDELLGWKDRAGEVEVLAVPGDHHSMMELPHVEQVAEHLAACLRDRR